MRNKEILEEEEFLSNTEERASLDQTTFSAMKTFEISDTEPKKRNGVKCFMVMVVIYLILLSIGAGLLVMEVRILQKRLWVLEIHFENETLASEDHPSYSLLWSEYLPRSAADAPRLQVLQAQLIQVHNRQKHLLQQVDNFTKNQELFQIKGERGAPGPPGHQGLPGIKGEAGLQGPKGAPGMQGATGAPGPQGEKGSKGDGGLIGPKGETGAKGDKGDLGLPGSMGVKGEMGVMGPPGAQGSKGDSGKPGPPGVAGIPGIKGHQGQPGERGLQGPPGAAGSPGAKGEPGSTGATGPKGLQGQKGTKGDSGVPGSAGVKGEKGSPGLAGPKGNPGPSGQKGDPGLKGSSGPQGVKGEKGQKGESLVSVRIIGSANRGRAEVFHDGAWGTICDDDWDNSDATVFCRMLGYSTGTALFNMKAGTGNIWLDNVACRGTEMTLWSCNKNKWGSHNCNHNEDAGVDCR
ncbi:macrophage receptor MARCO [Pteropus vampyrus]|uniref:Macrophage receptor MARCO n=1 Tax=Pteropus vampyrus TaxID=132908 RepID=A0A6P3QJY4_PTEVA|nr:macrophage receptor MARCO [Pteropus vampyrus]